MSVPAVEPAPATLPAMPAGFKSRVLHGGPGRRSGGVGWSGSVSSA